MPGRDSRLELKDRKQRSTLITLLLINAFMFLAELAAGIVSESTALIADAMDMLADALVYGISLYAAGETVHAKVKAAQLSGAFQILIGAGVAAEVVRRFIWGSEPESLYMIVVGFLALIANMACLAIIAKHRKGEVHMRASWIFSKNDVIANIGVIAGGVLVALLASPYPDLIIGFIISIIVMKGGISIIGDAMAEKRLLTNA